MGFFWSYNIIQYRLKYEENQNRKLVVFLFFLLALAGALSSFAGLYLGTTFIYQNILGLLYGIVYLVFCMTFDESIHLMCENLGFIVQTSRKGKFRLFAYCMMMWIAAVVYYNC